ncbi:MAG TPA: GlxA family transcriptional regulator [Solirubrobacteraceae bacterium]|jgi:transcriptional regulator GlxA family with amidase domain
MPALTPRKIVIVAFANAQILDIAGPSEVFALAERFAPGSYSVELLSSDGGEIVTSGGLTLKAHCALWDCDGKLDTLLLAGGLGVREALTDRELRDWLIATAPQARRVASVCTGAFLLAEAGLLNGRRATTHWSACQLLARRYPAIAVDPDPIFVRDGNVLTSAGVTAGIDLALALVEEDLGHEAALRVARELVLFVRRPGGQAQFSASLAGQAADIKPLRELQAWIGEHLDEDLTVEALAERVFMSPRNFARVFRAQTGLTPARYVESLRVERARALLEQGQRPIEEVATACGFGTVETLRRAFARRLGVAPSEYRQRFRTTRQGARR